ncbi:MAG: tetratricopeptide repeat protein, partial [Sedimentisphaerales bacterium]|nr:tetratricopeptide repeat protein [Sedimentisphaerales bacterium]
MAKRYFNWKLAIVLILTVGVLGVTFVGVRLWHRANRAEIGLEEGELAIKEGRWEDAARHLGSYISVTQDDVDILLKYAEAHLNIRPRKRNNIQHAVSAYRTVLRKDKGNLEATKKLMAMYKVSAPGEAEDIARKALTANPDSTIHIMLAEVLARQRKYEEAEKELQAIIEKHPDEISAYEALGQLSDGRPEEFSQPGEHWFSLAVKNNPQAAKAYIIRGAYYLRQRQRDKCLTDLGQAEKLGLSEQATMLRLAMQYLDLNILDKAKYYLDEIKKKDPSNSLLWLTWARYALQSNSKSEMLRIAEEGLKANPKKPWDFIPLAIDLFIQAEEYDRATQCINKMRQKEISPETLSYTEGIIAYRKGRLYEAIELFRKAVELGNKTTKLRLLMADLLRQTGNLPSALQTMATAADEQPNSYQVRLQYGRLLYQAGKWDEALEQSKAARQLLPSGIDAALLYVRAGMKVFQQNNLERDSQPWRELENLAVQLEKNYAEVPAVKILKFELALRSNDLQKARVAFDDIRKSRPDSIEAALSEVDLLNAEDKIDQVKAKLYEIVKAYPDAIKPVSALALLYAGRSEFDQAEKTVQQARARMQQLSAVRQLGFLLIDIYQRRQKQDKALNVLEELAQKFPQDISIKRQLLNYKQITEEVDKAQKLVDEIKKLEGESGWQWRFEQARLWFAGSNSRDKYTQIVLLLKEVILTDPGNLAGRMLLAGVYESSEEQRLALAAYREAYNRAPRHIGVIIPFVNALQKNNEFDKADEILNRTAREKLAHPSLSGLRLQGHISRGEWDSGINILEKLIEKDPDNERVGLMLASLQIRRGKFEEAESLLKKIRAAQPESTAIIVALIELKLKQNQSDTALRLCDELVEKSKKPSSYIVRARTLAGLDQIDRANDDYDRAVNIEPDSVYVWMSKSDFHRSLRQQKKATEAILRALEIEPDNIQIQTRTIALLLNNPDAEMAAKGKTLLDKALEEHPDNSELRVIKARTLLAEGTRPATEQAIEILQTITAEQPRNADAWLLLGNLALRQNQPGKAIDLALRGLISSHRNKPLLFLKARGEGARSPRLAIPTLKTLREIDPDDISITLYLADTYAATGASQEAMKLLREQLANCRNDDDRRKLNIALAAARYKKGDKDKAMKELDGLFEAVPENADPLLTQARLLKADRQWKRLKDKIPIWYDQFPQGAELLVAIAADLASTVEPEGKKTAEETLRFVLAKEDKHLGALQTLTLILQTREFTEELITLYRKILTITPDNSIVINNLAWILCEEKNQYE